METSYLCQAINQLLCTMVVHMQMNYFATSSVSFHRNFNLEHEPVYDWAEMTKEIDLGAEMFAFISFKIAPECFGSVFFPYQRSTQRKRGCGIT